MTKCTDKLADRYRKRKDIQALHEQKQEKIAACAFALSEHRVHGMWKDEVGKQVEARLQNCCLPSYEAFIFHSMGIWQSEEAIGRANYNYIWFFIKITLAGGEGETALNTGRLFSYKAAPVMQNWHSTQNNGGRQKSRI